jgi:predicted HD phosphohydrolase
MPQTDYAMMSDQALKSHWRAHPYDQAAQQAYFDRLNQQSRPVITTLDDPDFDRKLQQEIDRQINLTKQV